MYNFFLYNKDNKIVISNHTIEKVKSKFGMGYEIINSVKEKESIDVIKQRTIRSYPKCKFIKYYHKTWTLSTETKKKMAKAKKGKKWDQATKDKISATMKGKSNFEGKRHTEISRRKTSESMKGKQQVKGKTWIYNPITDKEKRIDDRNKILPGFRLGRSVDIVEIIKYNLTSTRTPTEKQSNQEPLTY